MDFLYSSYIQTLPNPTFEYVIYYLDKDNALFYLYILCLKDDRIIELEELSSDELGNSGWISDKLFFAVIKYIVYIYSFDGVYKYSFRPEYNFDSILYYDSKIILYKMFCSDTFVIHNRENNIEMKLQRRDNGLSWGKYSFKEMIDEKAWLYIYADKFKGEVIDIKADKKLVQTYNNGNSGLVLYDADDQLIKHIKLPSCVVNGAFIEKNKKYIIMITSSADSPSKIMKYSIVDDCKTYLSNKICFTWLKTSHSYISKNNVPALIHYNGLADSCRGLVVMLHGGPKAVWDNDYDPLTTYFVKNQYKVIKINPCGSIGYGEFYIEKLYGYAGIRDLDDIVEIIKYLNESESAPLYIVGESHGAYLALLLSLQKRDLQISRIIAVSPYVDIEFQYNYIYTRKLVYDYFYSLGQDILCRNPMHLVKECDFLYDTTLIHGKNDITCPYESIIRFCSYAKSKEKFKVFFLENYGHFYYSHYAKNQVYDLITAIIGGNI